MNAISQRLTINSDTQTDAQSDAESEVARHNLDLLVHALVMLAGAVLAGYCGIRVMDIGGTFAAGQSTDVAMSPDLLTISAFTAFFAIAALCILEAHRGWRKAAVSGARRGSRWLAVRSSIRLSRSGI